MADFEIRDLRVSVEGREILKGVTLDIDRGQVHAVMGPNGSGKSTLANAIMGHPGLEVTDGQIIWNGEDITEADPDERSRMGLFMAFQYPISVPGVTVTKYLRTVLNAHREARDEEPVPLKEFRQSVEEIGDIRILAPSGERVSLAQLCRITLDDGASTIYREGNSRYIAIKYSVRGRDLGGAVEESIEKVNARVHLPRGSHIDWRASMRVKSGLRRDCS